jgi:GGDEF domain-containing protein
MKGAPEFDPVLKSVSISPSGISSDMKKNSFRFPIGTKILLGFLPLLALICFIITVVLIRLDRVNRITREIVSIDMAAENAAQTMGEILLAQESFARRYLILRSGEMLGLFERREAEFRDAWKAAAAVAGRYRRLDTVALEHDDYVRLFKTAVGDSGGKATAYRIDSLQRNAFNRQADGLGAVGTEAKRNQGEKMRAITQIGRDTFRTVVILTGAGVLLIILVSILISRNILRSIWTLKIAANMVSYGTFTHLPKVTSRDELEDLSRSFNEMAERLIKLEEAYKDASPLTGLPGGIAIETIVKQLIERGEPFAFCMMDLDNFKPFNDRYGYARGNTVIKMTAEIIQKVSRESGSATDFVGHIGGDDFVLIADTERFEDECRKIIEEFDGRIGGQYDPQDLKNGGILSVSRQGERMTFPVMTISIAAINSRKTLVHNYIEVGEIIAELKKFAKKASISNLVIDRRGGKKAEKNAEPAK